MASTSKENIMDSQSTIQDLENNGHTIEISVPSRNSLILSVSIKIFVLGLLSSYFIWASVYFFDDEDKDYNWRDELGPTTCSGYGFLLILYILIMSGVVFNYIISPFLVPPFNKFIYRPIMDTILKFKYADLTFSAIFFAAILAYLIYDASGNSERLIPIGGLLVFILMGFLMSNKKRKVHWHTVLWGLKLQFIFGLLTIRWEVGRNVFQCVGDKITVFLDYSKEGAAFVYGNDLVIPNGGIFAFSAITTIYFLAFFINILYYYGVMQKVVGVIGEVLQFFMGTTICESVNCAANIFLGQSEAPLLLKPYLKDLTDSELNSIMTSGFATVSGSVLAAYISFGADPSALVTASVMSAPAALCYSKMVLPETEEVKVTKDTVEIVENEYESVLDAASQGITQAFQLVSGIVSSLIAFIAFVAFINGVLGWMGNLTGYFDEDTWSLELILGKIFIPISYIMGVPWDHCEQVGQLIGIKTMVNEFVAYQKMQAMQLTGRTKLIATYALCGFSNPGSIGIMISTMSGLIPNKKQSVLNLVFRAFVSGALVCFMTACIASMLYPEDTLLS